MLESKRPRLSHSYLISNSLLGLLLKLWTFQKKNGDNTSKKLSDMIQVDTIDEVEPHIDSAIQLEITCMKAVISEKSAGTKHSGISEKIKDEMRS